MPNSNLLPTSDLLDCLPASALRCPPYLIFAFTHAKLGLNSTQPACVDAIWLPTWRRKFWLLPVTSEVGIWIINSVPFQSTVFQLYVEKARWIVVVSIVSPNSSFNCTQPAGLCIKTLKQRVYWSTLLHTVGKQENKIMFVHIVAFTLDCLDWMDLSGTVPTQTDIRFISVLFPHEGGLNTI